MTPRLTAVGEVDIYSGLRNPTWRLTPAQALEFRNRISRLRAADPPAAVDEWNEPYWRPHGGYRGIELTFSKPEMPASAESFIFFDDLVFDVKAGKFLRDSSQRTLEAGAYATVPDQVLLEQLGGMSFAAVKAPATESRIEGLEGPDLKLQCESAPKFVGNTGPWKTHRLINNCYSYATNVLNKDEVQYAPLPGQVNVTAPVTMHELKTALAGDGLVDCGAKLPSVCPGNAHYLVVVLRRTTKDFHCLRLDRHGAWSHKDGKSTIRLADDRGNRILDLSNAAFHCDPVLAGIYLMPAASRPQIS